MSKCWTIGSKPDCDLVVDLPKVSGRHCRLTRDDDGYLLEDLGSTNGTYVNGARITEGVRIAPGDAITFGLTIPMPWPPEALAPGPSAETLTLGGSEIVIGRASECRRVIDLPMVSGRHARLFRSEGRALIEDLGSANGTFVNGRRIDGPTEVRSGDLINLGSYPLVLSVESRGPEAAPSNASSEVVPPPAQPSPAREEGFNPAPAPLVGEGWGGGSSGRSSEVLDRASPPLSPSARLAAQVGLAPLAGALIVMAMGKRPAASGLFWLGFAAIGFGLSNALLDMAPRRRRRRRSREAQNSPR